MIPSRVGRPDGCPAGPGGGGGGGGRGSSRPGRGALAQDRRRSTGRGPGARPTGVRSPQATPKGRSLTRVGATDRASAAADSAGQSATPRRDRRSRRHPAAAAGLAFLQRSGRPLVRAGRRAGRRGRDRRAHRRPRPRRILRSSAPGGARPREKVVVGLVRSADGDYRDWPAVRDWTNHIATALTAPAGIKPYASQNAGARPVGRIHRNGYGCASRQEPQQFGGPAGAGPPNVSAQASTRRSRHAASPMRTIAYEHMTAKPVHGDSGSVTPSVPLKSRSPATDGRYCTK